MDISGSAFEEIRETYNDNTSATSSFTAAASPLDFDSSLPDTDHSPRDTDPSSLDTHPSSLDPHSSSPLFPRKGEQKEKSAEERKNSTLGFLPNSAGPVMNVLSGLAIVLGVFFVLVWLMKRATPRQGGLLPKEVFEKLGSVPLSPKMHLQLFRLGGRLVLVSVTPDGMEPVAEVTDPDEVIHLIGLCKQNDPKSASAAFRQVLKQYTGEKGLQQQQQMTGGYAQQPAQMSMPMPAQQDPAQQYPAQQYPAQQYQQQQQPTMRRPVGVVRR
jgi:flagellar biogenesis protein FliO